MNKADIKRKSTAEKYEQLKTDALYRRLFVLTRIMDKWGIDPLLGFLAPALGDWFTSVMTFPYLYFAIVRLKSLPLTLAMIYNMLIDMLIGLIPYGIGDVLDIFHRSYIKNSRLLIGFVEGDRRIIDEVNKRAKLTVCLIVLLAILVGLLTWVVTELLTAGFQFLFG